MVRVSSHRPEHRCPSGLNNVCELPGGVLTIQAWSFAKNFRTIKSLCGRSTCGRSVTTALSWPTWSIPCERPSRRRMVSRWLPGTTGRSPGTSCSPAVCSTPLGGWLIGHELLVTFCHRHRRSDRQGSPATGPASASGRKRRSLSRHRCQDLSYSGGRLRGGIALSPFPPQGCTSAVWLPAWLPNGRKGSSIRTLSCAPTATRTRDLLLRRHSRNVA